MRNFARPFVVLIALGQGCTTLHSQRDSIALGMGVGAMAGSIGGANLSPNEESKGLNTVIFGLSGAIIGGVIGFFAGPSVESTKEPLGLEEREKESLPKTKEYVVLGKQELPDFLKKRMSPAVIEEFIEADQIGEDGSLHSPHKVYRIKHPAELIARPSQENQTVIK